MAFSPDYRSYPQASAATTAAVLDAGLRAYMLRVYNWMSSGLLVTAVVAYGIANTDLINLFYPVVQTPFGTARSATPLAMKVCGFGYPQAADVIMWHVIAMFAPVTNAASSEHK